MTKLFYVGDLRAGTVALPTRTVAFEAGVALEVDDDEAAQLAGPDWSTTAPAGAATAKPTKSKRAAPAAEKADPPAEPITASADTKEP